MFLVTFLSPHLHLAKKCQRREIADAQLQQSSRVTQESYPHGTKLQYVCNKNRETIAVTCVLGKWEGMRECSGKEA